MNKDEALRLALVEINRLFDTEKITGATIETIQAIKSALANEALERKAENARKLGLDYEPLEAKDEPIQKQIIKIKTIDEPCNQVMALGQMMQDWLQSQIADSNTSVDVGKGFSEFDLWVQCEGKELFITIKEKND